MFRHLFINFLIVLCGCTSAVPTFPIVTLKCRHLAPFGALTWQNLTGEKTVIVVGPTKKSKQWHAQAAIIDDDFVVRSWLVWDGKTWSVGKKEAFEAKDLVDVELFFSETLKGEYGGAGSPRYLQKIISKNESTPKTRFRALSFRACPGIQGIKRCNNHGFRIESGMTSVTKRQ